MLIGDFMQINRQYRWINGNSSTNWIGKFRQPRLSYVRMQRLGKILNHYSLLWISAFMHGRRINFPKNPLNHQPLQRQKQLHPIQGRFHKPVV